MTSPAHGLIAILPCNDLDVAEAFYGRLGFLARSESDSGTSDYRILSDGKGGQLHLTAAVEGWLVPNANPFGLYLYTEEVDALAAALRSEIIGGGSPEDRPWGMYEFALSDPDGTLVRIGWPTRLRRAT